MSYGSAIIILDWTIMLDEQQTKRAFIQCMQRQDCDSWLKGKAMIDNLLKSKPFLPQTIKYSIQDAFPKVRNVLMLVYIHSLGIEVVSYSTYKDRFQQKFGSICSDKHSAYGEIFLWVMDRRGEQRQSIIEFIIEALPVFLHKKMPYVSPLDLEIMVKIFNQMEVKTNHAMALTMDFVTILQKMTVGELNKCDSKENAIVMAVLVTLSDEGPGRGNLGLLIDEYLMGKLEEQNIDSFCFIHSVFLSQLATGQLIKIFNQLFQRGVNAYILQLVNRSTNILKEGEEFFKLKQLYANFILPIVAKRAKACTRQGVQKAALNLCESYAIGFNEHCDIGEIGADCLLSNVEMVTSENYRRKWIQLALLTAKVRSTEQFIQNYLRRKGIQEEVINQCRKPSTDKEVWNITTRSIKQHKNYRKQASVFIGISNKQFQCYIVSIVQALFMTKRLPSLLSRTSKHHKCVQQLKYIFKDLEKKSSYRIRVDRLQREGPKEFAQSDDQQDAQQYLLALMNTLYQYFKENRLQRQFKEIFEVSSQTVITCKACKHNTESKQSEYIHTISNKQRLTASWQETIYDFTCAYCKKKESTKRTSLSLHCQILIVHINRFSNIGGTIKKELPTQKILRKFGNYQLVGMVFHIGKMVQSGHYVYYAKIGRKRWVQFNDQNTSEFDLDNEEQEFQKEFKAEKTPYILFYQRVT